MDESSDLLFVTTVGSPPAVHAGTRKMIKQHIMRDIGKARRRPKIIKNPTFTLHFDSAMAKSCEDHEGHKVTAEPNELMEIVPTKDLSTVMVSPLDSVDVCEVHTDTRHEGRRPSQNVQARLEFSIFGSASDSEILLQEVFYDSKDFSLEIGIHRQIWWSLSHVGAIAHDSIIAMFGAFLESRMPKVADTLPHRTRYSRVHGKALRSVNAQLSQPHTRYSDDVMTAIMASMMRATINGETRIADIHWAGLCTILKDRGGLESIKSNYLLHHMISGIDTTRACFFDTAPLWPLPHTEMSPSLDDLVRSTPLPPSTQRIVLQWRRQIPAHEGFIRLFEVMNVISIRFMDEADYELVPSTSCAGREGKLTDEVQLQTYLLVILHGVQTYRRANNVSVGFGDGDACRDPMANMPSPMATNTRPVLDAVRLGIIFSLVRIRKIMAMAIRFKPADMLRDMRSSLNAAGSSICGDDVATAYHTAHAVHGRHGAPRSEWEGLEMLQLWCLNTGKPIAWNAREMDHLSWFEREIEVMHNAGVRL